MSQDAVWRAHTEPLPEPMTDPMPEPGREPDTRPAPLPGPVPAPEREPIHIVNPHPDQPAPSIHVPPADR